MKTKCRESHRDGGYEYRLVGFSDGVAVYSQHLEDPERSGEYLEIPSNFEVWIIGSFWRFPAPGDFGRVAWTYKTLAEAIVRKRSLLAPKLVKKQG